MLFRATFLKVEEFSQNNILGSSDIASAFVRELDFPTTIKLRLRPTGIRQDEKIYLVARRGMDDFERATVANGLFYGGLASIEFICRKTLAKA